MPWVSSSMRTGDAGGGGGDDGAVGGRHRRARARRGARCLDRLVHRRGRARWTATGCRGGRPGSSAAGAAPAARSRGRRGRSPAPGVRRVEVGVARRHRRRVGAHPPARRLQRRRTTRHAGPGPRQTSDGSTLLGVKQATGRRSGGGVRVRGRPASGRGGSGRTPGRRAPRRPCRPRPARRRRPRRRRCRPGPRRAVHDVGDPRAAGDHDDEDALEPAADGVGGGGHAACCCGTPTRPCRRRRRRRASAPRPPASASRAAVGQPDRDRRSRPSPGPRPGCATITARPCRSTRETQPREDAAEHGAGRDRREEQGERQAALVGAAEVYVGDLRGTAPAASRRPSR